MRTTKSSRTNTGFAGVSLSSGCQRGYKATNQKTGYRKMFLINSMRTREEAFLAALQYANR